VAGGIDETDDPTLLAILIIDMFEVSEPMNLASS
jgi:hypothetical protein